MRKFRPTRAEQVQTCHHYDRYCSLKCNECEMFFPCRFCHDLISYQQHVLGPQEQLRDSMQNGRNSAFSCDLSEDEDTYEQAMFSQRQMKIPHEFKQKAVTEIKCNNCLTIQPPDRLCKNQSCRITFGAYFCLECRLYDNDTSKKQFHCSGCGVCKTGGRENYFHCNYCKACVSIQVRHYHNHTPENTTQCPQCGELIDLDSNSLNLRMKCGHEIHRHCFRELSLMHKQCPACV